jgi:hypothetical protein
VPVEAECFSEFRNAVAKHFSPLAVELGLQSVVEKVFDFEIHVDFSSSSTNLDVALELGCSPWVSMGIVTHGREYHFGLHTLVEDVDGTFASVREVETFSSLDAQVQELARLTRNYAAEFLKGDVSRLSSLRVLRARAHRERNLELTGTRTGGQPLDHRPTLSELFSEADGAEFPTDVRLACVHAAVWDHEYPNEQVAKFLHVDPTDIQRIIDALDNIIDDSLDELRAIVSRSK